MPKRSSKSRDVNQIAAAVVSEAIRDPDEGKDPAAVSLGRRGGLKGGKARAAKLSADERREIAKKAAAARWNKHA